MRFGVVVFPGSNCDYDCYYVVRDLLGEEVDFIWHKERRVEGFDCLILPGGFSYGDYLRTGAIARFSPIMRAVSGFAARGGLVIGICNGFQILLESNLLPGAMMKNKNLRFICRFVNIRVENNLTSFTNLCQIGQVLKVPIAHIDGSYYADHEIIGTLKENNQIIFRYCNEEGGLAQESNPNGSKDFIAGISNRQGNVLGLMPHPERASESILGSEDGRLIFESVVRAVKGRVK
ncbi:phosphoribosylformylglycinamidine synthase subunit PurQ [Candidatus Aerophobetes bacterium]|uniref:Phosphoribosylformylglycinamidine synthase subunit PurQ n=1 Tax=Aerophobetes bacterium TaxID=2030807 RepID=A0A523TE69_UNCAE|nr:MAG: phosphoribosylformylglycinamidine synthase subunit PurQ [Candidatus Aerophobetes bacterium]